MYEERVLRVEDGDGWECRLERWYSMYMDKWFTRCTVFAPDGYVLSYPRMSQIPMDEEAARGVIREVRALLGMRQPAASGGEMRATNEERRDVAVGLRRLARDAAEGKPVGAADVMDELGMDMEDGDVYPERVEWLASLIDRPTCKNIRITKGMQPVETFFWFECSECHAVARTDEFGRQIRFCYACGAEVME